MADKKFALKNLFSKSSKDCCSVEMEEIKSDNNNNCETEDKNTEKQQNEVQK